MRRLPEQGQGHPAPHHAGAGRGGDCHRQPEPNQIEDGYDRRRHRRPVYKNGAPDQLAESIGLQRPEHSVDDQKGDEGKGSESRGLKAEPRPEHGRIAKRFEPESINVIGRCRDASKNRNTQSNKQGHTSNSAATPSRANYDITTVFLVARHAVSPQVHSATDRSIQRGPRATWNPACLDVGEPDPCINELWDSRATARDSKIARWRATHRRSQGSAVPIHNRTQQRGSNLCRLVLITLCRARVLMATWMTR